MKLIVPGYLRADGSWVRQEPWIEDASKRVNSIRRAVVQAEARLDGAIAFAECPMTQEFWDDSRADAQKMVDRSFISMWVEMGASPLPRS